MPKKITEKEAIEWLEENAPHIKLLEWPKKASDKCKFIDTHRNVKFGYFFPQLKYKIKKYPNRFFNITKNEKDNKFKQTSLKRYGVEHPFQDKKIQEKQKKTNIKKYGYENPFQNKLIKKKIKQTHLKKLNVEYPSQSKSVREKIKKSNIERYGVENVFQNEDIKNRIKEKLIEKGMIIYIQGKNFSDWGKEKGIASASTIGKFYKRGVMPWETKPYKSNLEKIIEKFLKEKNIKFFNNKKLPEHIGKKKGFNRPDFLLIDYNLIIECDGKHYHQDENKDKKRNKTYLDLGYKLLIFKEDEILNNIEDVKNKILKEIVYD